ncbi:expressed unknown protein [Ectocarpus siliculosus]|uniref:Uncharacterized protein n=1 Tax=Ectocarpus siliculosus TaxID=2880 RepID=D7G1I9_ECTSI|nr:expressed unknown protein [Ectocarpus siliculosus]|eukprot:CBJ26797.1 expressed unknown protein [Ectocarpus siliculosus]
MPTIPAAITDTTASILPRVVSAAMKKMMVRRWAPSLAV